jgi:hypothetical protein
MPVCANSTSGIGSAYVCICVRVYGGGGGRESVCVCASSSPGVYVSILLFCVCVLSLSGYHDPNEDKQTNKNHFLLCLCLFVPQFSLCFVCVSEWITIQMRRCLPVENARIRSTQIGEQLRNNATAIDNSVRLFLCVDNYPNEDK